MRRKFDEQKTYHEMKIPVRDITYIVLSVYLLTLVHRYHWTGTSLTTYKMDHTQVNLIQLYTFELELDFAEYIQFTDVHIVDHWWANHIQRNVISAMTVGLVYINLQPECDLPSSNRFGQFQKFGKKSAGATVLPSPPLRKEFLHGVWVLVLRYLQVRFVLNSSINVWGIKSFRKLYCLFLTCYLVMSAVVYAATSDLLLQVVVPIISNDECATRYDSFPPRLICLGPIAGGRSSCKGDSGGPLVIKQGEQWFQYGITNFGMSATCDALPNQPYAYADVVAYLPWIQEKTGG